MISLQQLLGKESWFLDLFEASASESCSAIKALHTLVLNPDNHGIVGRITEARLRDKSIHNDITEAICSTVVTSIEREDIINLAEALYKIPKAAEKIGQRIVLAPSMLHGFDLTPHMRMILEAAETLLTMIQALRRHCSIEEIRRLNHQLQQIEGKADEVVLELLEDLFQSDMQGRRIVFIKDIFELIEKITDRCRDAGNVIVQITLKAA